MLELKSVIDNLPIAVFVIDRNRRILLSNRLAKKRYGFDQNENRPKRLGEVIGCANAGKDPAGCGFSESCFLCQIKGMIDKSFTRKKNISPFEIEINICSMGVRCLRITISLIHSDEMRISEKEICVVTVEDITERKKQVKLAAAIETIGAICHELNQPLQAIMGSLTLLTTYQLEDAAIERVEKINNQIERIKRINNKLMNITDFKTKPYLTTNILDIEKSALDIVAIDGCRVP